MFLIQRVTSNAYQKQNLILEDGSVVSITLYFRPMQKMWSFTNIIYQDFTLTELKISNSPNMLNQWANQLPFGIACFSDGNREPQLIDDFSSGASKLYILNQEEVAAYTEFLRGSG